MQKSTIEKRIQFLEEKIDDSMGEYINSRSNMSKNAWLNNADRSAYELAKLTGWFKS